LPSLVGTLYTVGLPGLVGLSGLVDVASWVGLRTLVSTIGLAGLPSLLGIVKLPGPGMSSRIGLVGLSNRPSPVVLARGFTGLVARFGLFSGLAGVAGLVRRAGLLGVGGAGWVRRCRMAWFFDRLCLVGLPGSVRGQIIVVSGRPRRVVLVCHSGLPCQQHCPTSHRFPAAVMPAEHES
jgi:hypothetical protein